MDYVETGRGGITELRVHGVSGTPPEAMLEHQHTVLVAGDKDAGFYRRVWESEQTSQDRPAQTGGDDADRLEGYFWGGLTSGGWSRALYLLLLPFLLVNVAFFATPRRPLREGHRWLALRRCSEAVQRLLALSLTLTMILAMIEVSVDVVGWQCGREQASCGTGPLIGVPDWSWLRETGPRTAVTALAPLAVVLVLWWLARRTWASAEAVSPPSADATAAVWVTPLEDRSFWNGGEAVANLRSFHITAALALVGLAVSTPVLVTPGGGPAALWSGSALQGVLASLLVVVLVTCVVGVSVWPLAERRPPVDGDAQPPAPVGGWRTVLPSATLALVVVAGLAAAFGRSPSRERPPSVLPWLTWGINAVFWSQVVFVAVLTGVTLVQATPLPRLHRSSTEFPGSGDPIVTSPAWRGLALPAFALMGWIVASGFAAALALRIADTVGTPIAAVDRSTRLTTEATAGEVDPSVGKQILLPVGYFWASAAAVLVLAVVVVVGVVLVVAFLRSVRTLRGVVADRYGVDASDNAERVDRIARDWAVGQAPDRARSLAGPMLAGVAAVLVVGLVGYGWDEQWIVDHGWSGLLLAGNLIMTLSVAALVYAGRQAYTNPGFRRSIGILWDVGTFWPRATHPLAPPSYGERAIPDLLYRVEGLTRLDDPSADPARGDLVVLSCHSQGSVIGASVVAASSYAALSRTALLTYGNPLRRLYARFFPAYFGPEQLERTGDLLVTPSRQADTAERAGGRRESWPWRSLQRPSDPIGGPVFRDARPLPSAPPADASFAGDVDVTLLDPVFARAWGDRTWLPALGHSDYPRDPRFAAARCTVIRLRRQPPPSPSTARGDNPQIEPQMEPQIDREPPEATDQAQAASAAAPPTTATSPTRPR
jgi:hypothetical protein